MADPTKNNEVDLLDLILDGVSILKRNFLLIVAFFAIGMGLGLAYYFSSKKIYESKMIVSSAILTASHSKVIFDNINTHLSEGNRSALAAKLNISEKDASQLSSVKILNLSIGEVELKESDRYVITVHVYDFSVLPALQKAIISYLENHEFVKVRVNQNTVFLKQMIATVDAEIKDIEQLKERIYKGDFVKGNVMFDPTTVNSKIVELTEKKMTYQNTLQLVNSVQVIEGFTQFKKAVSPKASLSIAAGLSVGFLFVGLLIAYKGVQRLFLMADRKENAV